MNTSTPITPRAQLTAALATYQIRIHTDTENCITVENGYEIELEKNGIFKLRHEGMVVAPFQDIDELCRFIKLG